MASDCADWMKPRARSVYFSIFICLPSAYRSAPGHDPASRGALLRPIAPQSKLARDPARKAAQISADHARRHGFSIFIGFSAGRVDIPQPDSGGVSPKFGPACGRCGKGRPETEEAASQIRVQRYRIAGYRIAGRTEKPRQHIAALGISFDFRRPAHEKEAQMP